MTLRSKNINFMSFTYSVAIHIIIAAAFLLYYTLISPGDNLIEISYGVPGGGSGGYGPIPSDIDYMSKIPNAPPQEEVSTPKEETDKEANVPEKKNVVFDNEDRINIKPTKGKPVKETASNNANLTGGNNKLGKGIGNGTGDGGGNGNGTGNGRGNGVGNGYDIAWGGQIRKIYDYRIPDYPSGVSKEIDVKLKFTILPDGSVGKITVTQKADTRLEAVAMDALRLWRFEPLPSTAEQTNQTAIITFPFRLK